MSFDPLPPRLEQDVLRFAAAEHLSHDEAVLKLIETGLSVNGEQSFASNPLKADAEDDAAKAVESRRKRSSERQANRRRLAESRPETPDALIGFLSCAPEVAENIRRLAHERRSRAFGSL